MGNLFSWLRPQGLPNPTMAAEQRTLWCAFNDDLKSLIPVDCTVGESVSHVKERIKDKSNDLHVAAFRLNIFLLLTLIKHVFSAHEHQKLHPQGIQKGALNLFMSIRRPFGFALTHSPTNSPLNHPTHPSHEKHHPTHLNSPCNLAAITHKAASP